MRLYFMRHGEASDDAPSDDLRPLTDNGRARLLNAGKVLRKILDVDTVYSSPRVRARQTAEIIAEAIGKSVTIRDELNFNFSIEALKILITGYDEDARLLLVGHNPSISEVVQNMTGANINLKTGAIACVEVYPVALKGGTLKWLLTPRIMDELA
jgi:phosphohistidine phosphatase